MGNTAWKRRLLFLCTAFGLLFLAAALLFAGAGLVRAETGTAENYRIAQEDAQYVLYKGEEALHRSEQVSEVIAALEEDRTETVCRITFSDIDVGGETILLENGGYILEGSISGSAGMVGAVIEFTGTDLECRADISNEGENASGCALKIAGSGTTAIASGTLDGGSGIALRAVSGNISLEGGALTSACADSGFGTLFVDGRGENGAAVEAVSGSITNTYGSSSARAVAAAGEGYTVRLSGANVAFSLSDNGGTLINNFGEGSVILEKGTFSVLNGIVLNNAAGGAVSVTGGTVSSENGTAINNTGSGSVSISQEGAEQTIIISAKTVGGTINCSASGEASLSVSGGTIDNTSDTGSAIYANTSEKVDVSVSGGEISAAAIAVDYSAAGELRISGGMIGSESVAVRSSKNGANVAIEGGDTIASETAVYNALNGSITVSGGYLFGETAICNEYSGNIALQGNPRIEGIVDALGEELSFSSDFSASVKIKADESTMKNGFVLAGTLGSEAENIDFGFVNGRATVYNGKLVYTIRIRLDLGGETVSVFASPDGTYPSLNVSEAQVKGFDTWWEYDGKTVREGDAIVSDSSHTLQMKKSLKSADLSNFADKITVKPGSELSLDGVTHDLQQNENFAMTATWYKKDGDGWKEISSGSSFPVAEGTDAGEYKVTVVCSYTEGDETYTSTAEKTFTLEIGGNGNGNTTIIIVSVCAAVVVIAGAAVVIILVKKRRNRAE